MVSSARMMWIGIKWIVYMTIYFLFAMLVSIGYGTITHFISSYAYPLGYTTIIDYPSWLQSFLLVVILVCAIVTTLKLYMETIAVTDYFPDTGVY